MGRNLRPTIRYNEGVFYMITTNVSDKGNFWFTPLIHVVNGQNRFG